MMEELEIIRMASAMARHAGARHRVIAENVANADTPGYVSRDVKPFSYFVNEELKPRATRAGHVGAGGPLHNANTPRLLLDEAVQNSKNGNSVSLEQEMVKGVEAQGQQKFALTMMRTTHKLLRLGLGRVS
ncbi:MAG: FlgB family protein [Paracoccaceae bacterium]